MQKIQCRVAPSIGELEGTHREAWGTTDYTSVFEPCVFFGMYGLPDFYTVNRHQGKRYILWAGTDITHFLFGYWLDKKGEYKLFPLSIAEWINDNCENWVENITEYLALKAVGIESKICPSFMGTYPKVSYKWNARPKVYASVSGNEFQKYGWLKIKEIAKKVPEVDFYLYGNTKKFQGSKNVIVRGRVSKEAMNKEIADMQAGLRVLGFDGFSEILGKSVLMGQYPISKIPYPEIDSYSTDEELIALLKNLTSKKEPNLRARKYYEKKLNKYTWTKQRI